MQQLIGPQAELFERALAQVELTPDDVRIDVQDRGFFGGDKYRLPFFDALMDNPWKISPYMRTMGDQLFAADATMPTTLMSLQLRLNHGIRLNLLGDPTEKYAQRVVAAGDDALPQALDELWAHFGTVRQEYYGNFGGVGQVPPPDYFRTSNKLVWLRAEVDPAELKLHPELYYVHHNYDTPPVTSARLSVIPRPVRDAAALYFFALPDILRLRHDALEPALRATNLSAEEAYMLALSQLASEAEDDELSKETDAALKFEALADNCDWGLLNAGATLAASVAHRMHRELLAAQLPSLRYRFEFDTPVGHIILNNDFPTAQGQTALVISTHGTDKHLSVGSGSFVAPCSLCIDLAGDDQYSRTDPVNYYGLENWPSWGAGVFGYGILLDGSGNDTYESQFASQGCGIFGTGILCDVGGNDTYGAVSASQGSGAFGTGLLIDQGGNDTYTCYQLSQGYGYTLGAGLLLDNSGNDTYTANDTDIRYPSAQSAEHNSSLCQGMGMGRRADYTDGHSWAGGVGLLLDGAGDDQYSCAVFGQGCAYWYGVGALLDRGGSDQYNGMWYVQGAGAHFGLAVLQDDDGDDKYNATMNMAQGAGHDFTLGWLEDSDGNDSYSAPNLSFGAANANGIGVLWDKAGDDAYLSSGVTLGAGGGIVSPSLRKWMLNIGIFVDGGGSDAYWENKGAEAQPEPWDFAGDGKNWQRPGMSDPTTPNEFGVGIDG